MIKIDMCLNALFPPRDQQHSNRTEQMLPGHVSSQIPSETSIRSTSNMDIRYRLFRGYLRENIYVRLKFNFQKKVKGFHIVKCSHREAKVHLELCPIHDNTIPIFLNPLFEKNVKFLIPRGRIGHSTSASKLFQR